MTLTFRVPELLSPAGSLEKLKVAVLYGANAVYLGGQHFGLRAAADNFTYDEIVEGVAFAHAHQAKVYVAINAFLHDKDLEELPPFIHFLQEVEVDGVIVSDLGVLQVVRRESSALALPIHLSTQASCLNAESVQLWHSLGVKRVILGREVSLQEAKDIKQQGGPNGPELEMFIHGSLCMAYSGHCVISNYTSGRDSNRGGCAHSCRFEYSLQRQAAEVKRAFFMSSKDLAGLSLLPQFAACGIDSIKVEGRMKGHLYTGTVTKVYAEALRRFREQGTWSGDGGELEKVSHRGYTTGNLEGPADAQSIQEGDKEGGYISVGMVLEVRDDYLVATVKNAFSPGDVLEILPFSGPPSLLPTDFVRDIEGRPCFKTRPGTLVKLPFVEGIRPWNLIRKRKE